MASERSLRRIGILDLTNAVWAAGSNYTKVLACSLADACRAGGAELFFLSERAEGLISKDLPVKVIRVAPQNFPGEGLLRRKLGRAGKTRSFRGESLLRRMLGLSDPSNTYVVARDHGISVLLPLEYIPRWAAGVKTVGWIPDFQHVYLPEFFSREERRIRDVTYLNLAERAELVMLSSRSACEHFAAFAPRYAYKARVVPFPSVFAFDPPSGDARSSQRRFNFPEKYALVANQFWGHKNHLAVVEALGRLRQKGVPVPCVMTGLPVDYRDPSNRPVSQVLQAVASAGLGDQVTVLGQVPYDDLVSLMRTAAIVIQPSRFEGWSTVVQDAKALGRPLVCSDTPVHREQALQAIGFFPWDRPDVLADLLAGIWGTLEPGPDLSAEGKALAAEREFARSHGRTLLGICQEAATV